jgi:hypothetical protein
MFLKVTWLDAGRDPKCPPDPRFRHGIDIDLSQGAVATCWTHLPYPAKRCGSYVIECTTCRQRTMVTTAGRVDDPRSVKLGCKLGDKEPSVA